MLKLSVRNKIMNQQFFIISNFLRTNDVYILLCVASSPRNTVIFNISEVTSLRTKSAVYLFFIYLFKKLQIMLGAYNTASISHCYEIYTLGIFGNYIQNKISYSIREVENKLKL